MSADPGPDRSDSGPLRRTLTPLTLGQLDHTWMTRAGCTRRPDLPWTDDAHRVEDEIRGVMARVCTGCPVRERCRRYASDAFASAGFWAGGFRGGAYTGDLLDLLAELDTTELDEHYQSSARRAGFVHRKALAS